MRHRSGQRTYEPPQWQTSRKTCAPSPLQPQFTAHGRAREAKQALTSLFAHFSSYGRSSTGNAILLVRSHVACQKNEKKVELPEPYRLNFDEEGKAGHAPWCVQEATDPQRASRPWTCTRQYSRVLSVTPLRTLQSHTNKARRTFHQKMGVARVE